MPERPCRQCGKPLPYSGRGRPPVICARCREAEIAEKKRAYYEQNRAEIAEKKRAYREQNRACAQCDERLRHPSKDGLCGFCREERQQQARSAA